MKASDIPDAVIFNLVLQHARSSIGATLFDIEQDPVLQQFPSKVIRAKLRQMVAKGRLNGCACGCRGDFTPKTA